jgi:hypothetical protein
MLPLFSKKGNILTLILQLPLWAAILIFVLATVAYNAGKLGILG